MDKFLLHVECIIQAVTTIPFFFLQPKIQLCSKYERHTDHRSYGQRLELFEELSKPIEPFSIPKKGEDGEEEGGEEEAGQEEGGEEQPPCPTPLRPVSLGVNR